MMLQPIGLRAVAAPTSPRRLRVIAVEAVSPHLRRITCTGDLTGFPDGAQGSHIKLFLRREGQAELTLPRLGPQGIVWPPSALRPLTRTYSVRRYDPREPSLSIDFVLHEEAGPAARWAAQARVGDELGVAGPGGPNPLLAAAEFYLMVGDLSALPAIEALLELMPTTATGQVLLELPDMKDVRTLPAPAGVKIRWFWRRAHARSALPDAVRALSLDPLRSFAWLAGESSAVVAIRDLLLQERGFQRGQLYATPYWRETLSEEQYHEERHRIMDELDVQVATPDSSGVLPVEAR